MIRNLSTTEAFRDEIASEKIVLVDFYADWCEPCKWLDKILVEVDNQLDSPILILKVNTDKHIILSHQYSLKSVPVLMIFVNNELKWRMNGFMTTGEIVEKIKTFSRETK